MPRHLAILLCLLSVSCATPVTRVTTLDPGRSAVSSGTGIVVGRRETVNADGEPFKSAFGAPMRNSVTVRNVQTQINYELQKLDESSSNSDFYVELPAGDYFTFQTKGCYGSLTDPEIVFLLRFTVQPGAVTYVGTLRDTAPTLVPPSCGGFSVADELDPLLERFRQRYPELARDVQRSVFVAEQLR